MEVASSAAEGFLALQRFQPQVLISDIEMPTENGFDFMRRVRRLPRARGGAVAAVALTGSARPDAAPTALQAGYTRFLEKPVNIATLQTTVRELATSQVHEEVEP